MGHDLNSAPVSKIMTTQVITCKASQDIEAATKLMQNSHIRRLLVVNDDDSLAGFFSVDNLVCGSHELAGAVLESATPVH